MVVTVIQFFPATCSLGDPGEITVTCNMTCNTFRDRISAVTGINSDNIGIFKLDYQIKSVLNVSKALWDADRGTCTTNYYGTQIYPSAVLAYAITNHNYNCWQHKSS